MKKLFQSTHLDYQPALNPHCCLELILGILLWISLPVFTFGQDFQMEFKKHFETNDTVGLRNTLEQWEKSNPNDPELYTSYFNYHFLKAKQEVIMITTDEPDGENLEIIDQSNQATAYVGAEFFLNPTEMQKAFDKIDEGIKRFPNRLDMRFGKVYAFGQTQDWEQFTQEIIKHIAYSASNKNEWLWLNSEKLEDGEAFFLSTVQAYSKQIWDTGDDELLKHIREISEKVLEIYPDYLESINSLATTYLITDDFDQAIKLLKQAEKIDPSDFIVLQNIAYAYQLQGKKEMAIEYYQKVIEFAPQGTTQFAEEQLRKLKQN